MALNQVPSACPSDDVLVAYAGHFEVVPLATEVDEHIAACGRCQDALRLFAAVSTSSSETPSSNLPRVPGRYQLLHSLGRGGQGVVWKARDALLGREVALKLVRCSDPGHRQRLQAEARALAQVEHPHVLEVYDVDLGGDPGFITMPVCRGSLLEEAGASSDWRGVVRTMRAVGSGLAAVHRAGLVHRDIKPANLLRDEAGVVKISDFGIVSMGRSADEGPFAEPDPDPYGRSVSRRCGTPAYMGPEVLAGGPHDAASDQYAFFASLVHLLEGRPPPPNARWVSGAGLPRWLVAAVERGLSVEPGDRYPSMDAACRQLEGRSRWRAMVGWTAAVAVIGAGLGQYATTSAAPPAAACVVDQPTAWSPAMREAVARSGHVRADERAATLARMLDRFAAEVAETSRRYCTAGRHEARRCLGRSRERVDAMAQRLASGDVTATGVDAMVRLLPEFVSVDHCERIEERIGAGSHRDRGDRGPVAREIHGAFADELLGSDSAAARTRLAAVLAGDQLEHYPDLQATALRRSASYELSRADRGISEIEARLGAAERLALEADAPVIQARVWIELANSALGRGDHEGARSQLAFADTAIIRAGDPAPERMRAALVRANVDMQSLDFAAAVQEATRAAQTAASIGAPGFLGRVLVTRAAAMLALDRTEEAVAALEESLVLIRDSYGPEHPVTDEATWALGKAYVSAQRPWRAVTTLRPLADRLRETRAGSRPLASILVTLGNAYMDAVIRSPDARMSTAARYEAAELAFEQALAIVRTMGDVFRQGGVESALGRLAQARGRHADAAAHYARAVGLLEQTLPANDLRLADARTGLETSRARVADEGGSSSPVATP